MLELVVVEWGMFEKQLAGVTQSRRGSPKSAAGFAGPGSECRRTKPHRLLRALDLFNDDCWATNTLAHVARCDMAGGVCREMRGVQGGYRPHSNCQTLPRLPACIDESTAELFDVPPFV